MATVVIRQCDRYISGQIEQIVLDGLVRCGVTLKGKTLVKPNCVASGAHFPHAYTRPEFLEGVFRALQRHATDEMTELAIGERCGITVPTRFTFKRAKYYPMLKRVGVDKIYHFDEVDSIEVPLRKEGRLRDSIYVPRPVVEADTFINCPKFKAHPWTTVTFSMKNYIGLQDDRHRLIDHDHRLNNKVVDLQEILQPDFIAIDAITAGEGRMLTPIPFPLGLVIMGDNQVAFDSVCCHIIGLDPLSVPHIRMAHERGYGPVALDKITIVGDVTLEQAQARAKGFKVGLIPVDEYFRGTNIQAYGGKPPSKTESYCWGGCPGALQEAVEILRVFDSSFDEKVPRMHVVFGAHEGEIDAKPGEKVILMGDCATYEGLLQDVEISEPSVYVDHATLDPAEAKDEDIFAKMVRVSRQMHKARKADILRIHGCPVSVAEQVLALVYLGKLKNPYLSPSEAIPFVSCYLSRAVRNQIRAMLPKQLAAPTD
jgi:uncharacterized protein (DUF362 family)